MAEKKQGPSLMEPAPRWLVTVALVMIGIIVVVSMVQLLSDDSSSSATPETKPPDVTVLALPDAANAKCRVPNVDGLTAQSMAFDATATEIDGRTVTLDVAQWFRGEPTTTVTVEAVSPELQLALSGVEFEVGQRYLVSGSDGRVALCGLSAEYNQELADLFEQAYVS